MTWKIAEQADGGFRGEMGAPTLGATHLPFVVEEKGPFINFKPLSRFRDVSRTARGDEADGNFFLGGGGIPFVLERTAYQPEPMLALPESA